jgi:phenol 2-monooxygenase (NADPH)
MATAVQPGTWENGFRQPATGPRWIWKSGDQDSADQDPDEYVTPPSKELVSSGTHNSLGVNVIRTWPTLYDGTNNPHMPPAWWQPSEEVDVLIVGGNYLFMDRSRVHGRTLLADWILFTLSRAERFGDRHQLG